MYENHCGQRDCYCTHHECDRGWIDAETTTAPCEYCRGDLRERVWKAQELRAKGYPYSAVQQALSGRGTKYTAGR